MKRGSGKPPGAPLPSLSRRSLLAAAGRRCLITGHRQGRSTVDPDTQDRRPTQAALDEIIAFRDRRFPLLRGAPLTEARVCQDENSSNGDFLVDFHPRLANVLLVGCGSGHNFKHGPEVSRYAAARLFGSIKPEPRFSLEVENTSHIGRHKGIRTAQLDWLVAQKHRREHCGFRVATSRCTAGYPSSGLFSQALAISRSARAAARGVTPALSPPRPAPAEAAGP